MTNTELASASKVMLGTTEATAMYIGDTLMWQKVTSLPYNCEVEYLQSSGTLYIDLNIVPDENTGIYVKIQRDSTINDQYAVGLRDTSGNTRWCIGCSNAKGWYYGYGSYAQIGSSSNNKNDVCEVTLNYLNDGKATVTASQGSGTKNLSLLSFTPQNNIRLFGSSGVNDSYTKFYGNIYSIKISQGDRVVHDLIPVRVGSVGYMYDKISNLLFGNDGTGDFVVGPPVLPTGYTLVEYISSTSSGSLYIDLDIMLYDTLNKNYDLATKFNIIGPGSDNNLPTFFGCQTTTNPWPGTFIRMSLATAISVTGRYIGANVKDNNLGGVNTVIELPVQTSPNKNLYSLNNSGQTHTWGTSLFCTFNNQNKTGVNRFCEAKLYYFKLFVEGTLVRDMIPCIDPNNVVGMYDVVNNVFYSSPNGAAFVAGPTV